MLQQKLYRRVTRFSSALLLVGSTLLPIAAQNPGSAPPPQPVEQEKGEKSTSPEPPKSQRPDPKPDPKAQLDRLQKEILKGTQPVQSGGQSSQPDDPLESFSNEAIKIDTDLIQLDVTVIDPYNNPIFGLSKDDFTIYEDKVKQSLESVSSEEIPISFGIVVDTSGSMRDKLQTISDSALSLIKQKREDDEVFVAQFKTEYETVQDFTVDENDLEWAIGQLFTTGGTSLLDAIINSSKYAQKEGKRRRRAVIVISDGLEANSSIKEKEALDAIRENEVQLYMIGFIKREELSASFGKTPAMKAKELLLRLAEDSGGRAFFPNDLSEIPAIAAQIGKDLRTQYIVSYYPTNEKKDNTYRSVRVDVKPQSGQRMVARARQGYFAGGEKEIKQSELDK
ncbi:MAG TPA: VWA domain-containing protein [Blastocatellia bacterium]|nr:VWA domain-containing protein [Blastocatellia bacterium]